MKNIKSKWGNPRNLFAFALALKSLLALVGLGLVLFGEGGTLEENITLSISFFVSALLAYFVFKKETIAAYIAILVSAFEIVLHFFADGDLRFGITALIVILGVFYLIDQRKNKTKI